MQQLIDHMVGSTDYLLRRPSPVARPSRGAWSMNRNGAWSVLEALRRPGVLDRMCVSPLGFT